MPENITIDDDNYSEGSDVTRTNINVQVPKYMLQEYLSAFRAAVKAGAKGMMYVRCQCKRSPNVSAIAQ